MQNNFSGPSPRTSSAESSQAAQLPRTSAQSLPDLLFSIVAWLLSLCSPLALLDMGSPALMWLGRLGVLALVGLCLRLVITGYTGFERRIGLRIILNPVSDPRWTVRFFVSVAFSGVALGFLLISNHWQWGGSGGTSLSDGGLWSIVRLVALLAVAAGTLSALLFLLIQRFSIFGTTSIVGVVLGVAALLVVQSVATGFLHEFENRVLAVYAHVNVTRQNGIARYDLFEDWLRDIPDVTGASPFAYYYMGLAPNKVGDGEAGATVLVKGIDPETAHETIELAEHLERSMGRKVPLTDIRSFFEPHPRPKGKAAKLPAVIQALADQQDAAKAAVESATPHDEQQTAPATKAKSQPAKPNDGVSLGDDDWIDPPLPGENLQPGELDRTRLPTMFIGKSLAQELELEVDEIVRLANPGSDLAGSREPDYRYYVVAGIFDSGFQEYDERLVYVHLRELQRFRFGGQNVVSGVDLRLSDTELARDVGREIRAQLGPGYTVLEWQKLNENLFSSIETQKNVITILLGLVICVACFNVWSALWTMVVRRTAEVAIMMSMGATGSQVARIFQVTGMTIGFAGSLAGLGFGLVMCWLVEIYGYTLDPEVYFIEELPVEISVSQIFWILGLALTFCFIATIPPSLQAARIRPVEGLRYE